MQFLSVSQSFHDVKDAPSSYHMAERGWLPRFRGGAEEVAEENLAAAPEKTDAEPQASITVGVLPPLPPAEPARPCTVRRSAVRKTSFTLPRWMQLAAEGNTRRHRRGSAAGAQAVRVVRNDLSLSDLEIVTETSVAGAGRQGFLGWLPIHRANPVNGWNWLVTRLFKNGSLRA